MATLFLIKSEFFFKKPFNPVLGEVFNCSWKATDDLNSKHLVSFTAEKVSHHPLGTLIIIVYKNI